MTPELFLPHQAPEGRDTLLDRRQFSGCTWIGSPISVTSFERVQSVFNPPDQFAGISFDQGRFVRFSPAMRYTSHRDPPCYQTTWNAGLAEPQGATEDTLDGIDTMPFERGRKAFIAERIHFRNV